MSQAVRPYLALLQFSIPNWAEGMAGAQLGRVHLVFTLCWTRLPREAEGGAGRGDGDVGVGLWGLPSYRRRLLAPPHSPPAFTCRASTSPPASTHGAHTLSLTTHYLA